MKIWRVQKDLRLADLKLGLIILHLLIKLKYIGYPADSHQKTRWKILWFMKLSGFASSAMVVIVLCPPLSSVPPAEASREVHLRPLPQAFATGNHFAFRKALAFYNAKECGQPVSSGVTFCDPLLVHVAITLDAEYLQGSMAALLAMQHLPKDPVGHVLVHQKIGPVIRAESEQPNDMVVADASKCLDLRIEAVVVRGIQAEWGWRVHSSPSRAE